ncbi:hypothetical protein RCDURKIN_135 [Rhodobacter phage RcDurkin]|nr:hypothetical protein RCDURKIN_135 [Rhodobacter phage RcDurkin]QXN72603.1 hypothetical protein RCTIPTONUS_133 [Rhodobacter phage RcTiptonus]UUV44504.1 hypothetical protein RCMENCHIE_135 [Rhodobacter phage RcMenchie]
MLSRQTPNRPAFAYNPLAGAEIHFFPLDTNRPRVYRIESNSPRHGTACGGRVEIERAAPGQYLVTVNGKRTERFSLVFAGKKRKQLFATT